MSRGTRRRALSHSSVEITTSSATATGPRRPMSATAMGTLPVSMSAPEPKPKRTVSLLEHFNKRTVTASLILAIIYIIIAMSVTLSTGMVPSLRVSAGFAAFAILRGWDKALRSLGLVTPNFTRQENATIQACVIAATSVVFSGGFGNYMFAMSTTTANQSWERGLAQNTLDMSLGQMILFLVLSFSLGLCIVIRLSKMMIVDFKLPYPTGNASGHLINYFHTEQTTPSAEGKEEMDVLLKYSILSFLWSFIKWCLTGGKGCRLVLPLFNQKVYEKGLYLELSATYMGIGMICSYMTNASQLIGGILSWAILWPFFEAKRGDWYPIDLEPNSMGGLQGYKVFIALATITGEGVYNCARVSLLLFAGVYKQFYTQISGPPTEIDNTRDKIFTIPPELNRRAFIGYVILTLPALLLSWVFDQVKWYYIVGIYFVVPFMAFFNAYGCGLTDLSLTPAYGRLAIFAVGAVARASSHSILSGLFACGVVMSAVSTASDLMHDYRTGYLTETPPLFIFVSQCIGIIIGCVISPCVFWFFSRTYDDLGTPPSVYPVPYAFVYRSMSAWAVDEFSVLPKYCIIFCFLFLVAAIAVNFIRDQVDESWARLIPGPMAMAIGALAGVGVVLPDSIGSNYALDMCIGSIYLLWWKHNNRVDNGNNRVNQTLVLAMVSGLICGEGIWTFVGLFLSTIGWKPPFCIKVLSREEMTTLNINQP